MSGDDKYFYLLTQSNQNIINPTHSIFNPYYSLVSIQKFKQATYLGNYRPTFDRHNIEKNIMDRQSTICLHDYLPGIV